MSSFAHRLWDDELVGAPDRPRPRPQFASSLINQLGLARAPRARQEQGILGWLNENEPSAQLTKSLTDKGFGHLLNHPHTA